MYVCMYVAARKPHGKPPQKRAWSLKPEKKKERRDEEEDQDRRCIFSSCPFFFFLFFFPPQGVCLACALVLFRFSARTSGGRGRGRGLERARENGGFLCVGFAALPCVERLVEFG